MTRPISTIDISVHAAVSRAIPAKPVLIKVARFAAAAEGFQRGVLSIAIVGDRRMARLHEQFLNVAGTTDVITFDLGVDRATHTIEGELVICADVAERQARRRGRESPQSLQNELALYVVHGILHLAGYDDHTDRDYRRMHAREDELLTAAGVGPVFAQSVRHIARGPEAPRAPERRAAEPRSSGSRVRSERGVNRAPRPRTAPLRSRL